MIYKTQENINEFDSIRFETENCVSTIPGNRLSKDVKRCPVKKKNL